MSAQNDTEKTTPKNAFVIGATGAFGSHAAVALIKHGWRVTALARDPNVARAKAGERMPIDWIKGDAMTEADVVPAAAGARIIVHAANPPGYRDWDKLVLPMFDNTLAAARRHGGRIVLPGNVYNYGPRSGPCIAEDAPQAPATRKGKIRVEMEARLAETAAGGVKALVLRAGDFFGPGAPLTSLGWLTARRAGRVAAFLAPGPRDVGHAFAYLPDLAEAMARLVDNEDRLEDHAVFHFAGSWLTPGDLAAAIRAAAGNRKIPVFPFPWPLVFAMAPFNTTLRELLEMRYLWRAPIGLDGSRLEAFLGATPSTPLVQAVRATLADLGALESAETNQAGARGGSKTWNTCDLETPA